jgi:catechol 2,3-dioxygenase-like lactoylglutathione lyase family enzyme
VVATGNGVNVDFMDKDGNISMQHYAFLVSEAEFDQVLGRVRQRGLQYWADPARSKAGEINHHDGGRGVYFEDPNGHFLEVITRPYGSGGWEGSKSDISR